MAEEEKSSSKVKFLCSHGGKILPRPSDGYLKYVGGETRVVCVPRSIAFSDFMEKIRNLFEGDFVIKYQIGSEELDALVSVKSDEDLHHMFDEYDRVERLGASKLRSFLFPAKSTLSEIHSPIYPMWESLEQRFVDAVNGVVRPTNAKTSASTNRLKTVTTSQSECTSPRSPSPRAYNSSMPCDHAFHGGGLTRMNKVHSSPSLCTLANQNSQPSSVHNNTQHHHRSYYRSYQTHQQHQHQHQHQQYHSGHHPFGKPPEHHGGSQPWPTSGRDGFGRVPSVSNLAPASHQSSAHSGAQFFKGCLGNGGHNRWVHVGKPPVSYVDGSSRSADVSPTHRGVIWE